jgi:hypothetical protein
MGTQLLHNYTVKQLVKIFDIDQPGNTTGLEIYENPKKDSPWQYAITDNKDNYLWLENYSAVKWHPNDITTILNECKTLGIDFQYADEVHRSGVSYAR